MTTKEAIVKVIGREKYNVLLEAGIADIDILENACLTSFLSPTPVEGEAELRLALSQVWNAVPGTFNLNLDTAQ